MRFGIRREADLTNIEGSLTGELRGIPIELALPYKTGDYMQCRHLLPGLVEYMKTAGIVCNSVHATQGRLTSEDFMTWASDAVRLAEDLGAEVVVFHPENSKKEMKGNLQVIALQNIKRLQRETGVKVAIETFGGPKRILTPEEIVANGLSMVLDTSHLFRERTLELIGKYHEGIASVHLSEERFDEREGKSMPHMPVEKYGFEVLDRLKEKGWAGIVTLEYLPWHHHRLLPDREMLEEMYGQKTNRVQQQSTRPG